jgi:hypothetical protein
LHTSRNESTLEPDPIVHTHAKDGVLLRQVDPEPVNEGFAEGGITGISATETWISTHI